MQELPDGFSPTQQVQDLPPGFSGGKPDLTVPSDNKEGLYSMYGSTGGNAAGEIKVPYNKVPQALQTGATFYNGSGATYDKDKAAEGKSPSWYQRLVQSPSLAPNPNEKPGTSVFGNMDKAAARTVLATPGYIKQLWDAAQAMHRGEVSTGGDEFANLVNPAMLPKGLYDQYQQDKTVDPKIAMQNLMGSLLGSAATAALFHGAAKRIPTPSAAMGKVADKARNILTGGTKTAADLNSATMDANAKTQQANQDVTSDFNQKTANAQHETAGRELAYNQSVNNKASDIEAQDTADQAKLANAYQDQLAKTRAHNQQVLDKHKAVSTRLNQQNEATNQTLGMRQQQQTDLDDMTQKYFAQEDAAKTNAKGQENAAWLPWRQKMQDVTIDGKEISDPLQKISTTSPEVGRALRQLQPPPSEAPADSNYAQDRAAIMQSLGYKGDYFDLPESTRATVDKIATSNGFEPDPIDFDPQPGKPIPVELVHRANSILQSYIRNGRYEGPILGEMKQVAKVLRAAVSRASTEAGALPDLTAAREATVKYQDAFGRDRYQPQTQDDIREQQANPEAYKERDDEERLAKAAQFDPTLVDSFRGVKAARENLKRIPSEDQLRKGLKQVPRPPTVGDIRPGYGLLAEPGGPPASAPVNNPISRAAQQVPLPERVGLPQPPMLTPEKTIGPEDVQTANATQLASRAEGARKLGSSKIASGIAAVEAIQHAISGNWQRLGIDVGARVGLAATTYGFARLLENPNVVSWLSKPTPAQVAAISPEVARGMGPLIQEAQAQGIKISPAITAAISAHGGKTQWWDQPTQ